MKDNDKIVLAAVVDDLFAASARFGALITDGTISMDDGIDAMRDRMATTEGAARGFVYAFARASQRAGGDIAAKDLSINEMAEITRLAKGATDACALDGDQRAVVFPFPARPVEVLLRRLLAEATSPLPEQAPAIQCGVMLAAGNSIMGSLSITPEGGLRMLAVVGPDPKSPSKMKMVEYFFDWQEIVSVAREVDVNVAGSVRLS